MTRELVMECNNYVGPSSTDRCNMIQEYVTQTVQSTCSLKTVKMIEVEIMPNLIQPTLVIRYENGEPSQLVEVVDKILFDIGITAIKAVVNEVVTKAIEGALVGGGAGLVAGTTSKNAKAAFVGTFLGALLGGVIGNFIGNSIPVLVSTKEHGRWNHQPILQQG